MVCEGGRVTAFLEWRDEVWRRHLWDWYLASRKPKTLRTRTIGGSGQWLVRGRTLIGSPKTDKRRARRAAFEKRRAQRCRPLPIRKIEGEKWPTMAHLALRGGSV